MNELLKYVVENLQPLRRIPEDLWLPCAIAGAVLAQAVEDSYDQDEQIAADGRAYVEECGEATVMLLHDGGGPAVDWPGWIEETRATWREQDKNNRTRAVAMRDCRAYVRDLEYAVENGVTTWKLVSERCGIPYPTLWYYRVGHIPGDPLFVAAKLRSALMLCAYMKEAS